MAQSESRTLGEGRFLRLLTRDGWEYAERTRPVGAAFIAALTDDGRMLLTEEYRIPVRAVVIGCPAGLIGDLDAQPDEALEEAVKRELIEETGYQAERVTFLTRGPTSPGLSNEVIDIVLAEGLRRVAPGGGIEGEHIVVREVPLAEVDAWLAQRVHQGSLIDPKVYSALYFIRRRQ